MCLQLYAIILAEGTLCQFLNIFVRNVNTALKRLFSASRRHVARNVKARNWNSNSLSLRLVWKAPTRKAQLLRLVERAAILEARVPAQ